VTLRTAKSLLYRFAQRQPMDAVVRSTKVQYETYLPVYDDRATSLLLPAHIDPKWRTVHLPNQYAIQNKKDKKNALALIACVRLHMHGLFSDRMLPLEPQDIRNRLVKYVLGEDTSSQPIHVPAMLRLEEKETRPLFIHEIILTGEGLRSTRNTLNVDDRRLAVVAERPLEGIPLYFHRLDEFGTVSCQLGAPRKALFSPNQVATCLDCFALLMNARWMPRSKRSSTIKANELSGATLPIGSLFVCCVDSDGTIEWHYMESLLRDSARDDDARAQAAQSCLDCVDLDRPRLWCPTYNRNATYVAIGPAGIDCSSSFPSDEQRNPGVRTYQDYFHHRWQVCVDPKTPLFRCVRLWTQPQKLSDPLDSSQDAVAKHSLTEVNLPKSLCIEVDMVADTAMALETILLPQFLYHLERVLTATAFIEFCRDHFPSLYQCVQQQQEDAVSTVLTVLSAKSCCVVENYDRLEYLGDAVLSLLNSDAILNSVVLKVWISNLHEGDLDGIRSFLCCNAQLHKACKIAGIDRFILTDKLQRGVWVPPVLCVVDSRCVDATAPTTTPPTTTTEMRQCFQRIPSVKVCADVVEALLGLVFHTAGYGAACAVAEELHLTISQHSPSDRSQHHGAPPSHDDTNGHKGTQRVPIGLMSKVASVTGYASFKSFSLLQEAFCHPTNCSASVKSYQQLEWLGDSVLKLCARQFLFASYPTLAVGEMVNLEEILVSNETLAFLSFRSGLHTFLEHRDASLPFRFEAYATTLELGRGLLWSTNPPKVMADIVEALAGAIHVDGGFAEGQRAMSNILSPIFHLFQSLEGPSPLRFISHPKRELLELGGELFEVRISGCSSNRNSADSSRSRIVVGSSQCGSSGTTATVSCLGHEVLSICTCDSASVDAVRASNRACALVLQVLKQSPTLKDSVLAATRQVLATSSSSQDNASCLPHHG
jgi:dsRNA-specific ribonuclease